MVLKLIAIRRLCLSKLRDPSQTSIQVRFGYFASNWRDCKRRVNCGIIFLESPYSEERWGQIHGEGLAQKGVVGKEAAKYLLPECGRC